MPEKTLELRTEDITPERAAALLGKNPRNRRISPHRVAMLSREMAEGRWRLNGESIKIDKDGRLKDGQHRLAAVMHSGKTIRTVVVYGIGDVEQETLDTGARRSTSDVLALRGESESATLAGALLLCWKMDRTGDPIEGGQTVYPTHSELTAYLDQNPKIRASIPIGRRANSNEIRYPSSKAVGLHFLMSRKGTHQADEFWEMLSEGTGITAKHPVQILRRQLIRDLTATRRMRDASRIAITIKAWNAFRAGKSARMVFAWRAVGRGAEAFPTIE